MSEIASDLVENGQNSESNNLDSKIPKVASNEEGITSEAPNLSHYEQLPDFPKRNECNSKEEYEKGVETYYEQNGLRQPKDFTEEEKMSIVIDITENDIKSQTLSEKYNTTVFAIRDFVYEKGLKVNPVKFADFPKKSKNMTSEEYQEILRNYYKEKHKSKRKQKQKARLNNRLKKLNESGGDEAVDAYLMDFKKEKYKNKELKKTDNLNKNCKEQGVKCIDEFSEEEKKEIVDECTDKLIGATVLGEKYNTLPPVIRYFVRIAGLTVTPDDLSQFPDYPKKSENMSKEEFQENIQKYWEIKTRPKFVEKIRVEAVKDEKDIEKMENNLVKMIPEDIEKYPDFPEYCDGISYEEYAKILKKYWRDRTRRQNPEKQARKTKRDNEKRKKWRKEKSARTRLKMELDK